MSSGTVMRIHWFLEQGRIDEAAALFGECHHADQGDLLLLLGPEARETLLGSLSTGDAARVMEYLEADEAADLFEYMDSHALSDVLDEARADVAADVLRQLPSERSDELLDHMEESEDVVPLLEYDDDSAGGLMRREFLSISSGTIASNGLDSLRLLLPEAESIGAIFAEDDDGRLEGVLNITRLALARPGSMVSEIMDPDVTSVSPTSDQEECARLMERYDLPFLPVVDRRDRLLGVILVEDVVDVLEEEATEDMYGMTGIGGERVFGSFTGSVRRRLPWLSLNLATTFLAALVIVVFESTLVKAVAIAAFLPVVAGQGGIAGTQTLTLVVRSMALGDVPPRTAVRLVRDELALGLLHGLLVGVVVGLAAFGWKGSYMLGVIVGVALAGNMVVAGAMGAAVPVVLRALRLDPAVGSAVLVTTLTDVLGFLMLLGLAALLLTRLG